MATLCEVDGEDVNFSLVLGGALHHKIKNKIRPSTILFRLGRLQLLAIPKT